MKEWVGDGKLIVISMTVSSINDATNVFDVLILVMFLLFLTFKKLLAFLPARRYRERKCAENYNK